MYSVVYTSSVVVLQGSSIEAVWRRRDYTICFTCNFYARVVKWFRDAIT